MYGKENPSSKMFFKRPRTILCLAKSYAIAILLFYFQTSAIPLHADKETSDEDITLSPDPSGNHVGESTALHDNSLSSCTSPYGPGISCNRAGTSQHLGSPTLLPSSSNPHNSPRPEQILSSSRENTSSIQEPLPKKSKQKALGMRRR